MRYKLLIMKQRSTFYTFSKVKYALEGWKINNIMAYKNASTFSLNCISYAEYK